MKNIALKTILILLLLLALTSSCAVWFYQSYQQVKQDKQRLSNNLVHLNERLGYYHSRNGRLVGNNRVLSLRLNEFKQAFKGLSEQIHNLNIKLNRVQSLNQSVIEQQKSLVTVLKDSIINDTIQAKVFNYQDDYYKVKGVAVGDTQRVDIHSRDSLIQVVYKGKRKRPYLWFFSPRQLEQVIISSNPNNHIIYSKHIQISR